jgi:hypothetical protein
MMILSPLPLLRLPQRKLPSTPSVFRHLPLQLLLRLPSLIPLLLPLLHQLLLRLPSLIPLRLPLHPPLWRSSSSNSSKEWRACRCRQRRQSISSQRQ